MNPKHMYIFRQLNTPGVFDIPGVGQLASDDFNRADAANLGANWTNKNSAPGIFSNQVDVTVTSDENIAYWNGVVWPNNQYSQATVKIVSAVGRAAGVGVRLQTGANRSGYYGGYERPNSGDDNIRIWKYTGGTWGELATLAFTLSVNDIIKITATGTGTVTLKLYVNGVEKISTTDSTGPYDAGNAGISVTNTAGDVAFLDDWSGGSL